MIEIGIELFQTVVLLYLVTLVVRVVNKVE